MADSKRHGWSKPRRVLVGVVAVIALIVLYHWIHLWGIAVLAVGLFLLWKYVPLPHKTRLGACLMFAVIFVFAAGAWNSYNLPPKLTIDNALADSIDTDNNTPSYTVTGNVASHKSVHLTINGTNVGLNSSDDFSYKTSLNVGDNNYTFVATNGSGEDRQVLTIHRDTKAEDAANNSSSSDTTNATPAAPTAKQKVADWFNQYGYLINAYNPDFNQINKDAGNSDTAAVGTDCQKLASDVAAAQKAPAIPDAQSASDFSSALTYYQSGATECVTAANNDDSQGLIDAAGLLAKGNDKIKATTADIKAAE
jgi:hypothetical protein